ncbi:UNVERIFIED_CONTAM: hypothetical protein Slati_3902100 [Sesamum latifolium]|uniref:Uncharacterized protein n=1 Tax=Sesamum latifolium TaxID=2727402 RepID=A0AAW2TMR7_9LAMI
MFSKLMYDHTFGGSRATGTPPPSRSSRGTPTLSKSKGKRPAIVTPGTSSKTTKVSSAALLRVVFAHPPLFLGGTPLKSNRSSIESLYTKNSINQARGGGVHLGCRNLEGELTPRNKRLLTRAPRGAWQNDILSFTQDMLLKWLPCGRSSSCPRMAPPPS